MIIGIAGTIGAGKGTVVEYLKSKGFAHYSASAVLRSILRERGLPETRTYMSPLADELMALNEGGVLFVAHERAEKDGAENYVLEAIHRESEAAYLRKIGGILIGVDAQIETRYERTIKRKEGVKDEVTYEEFLEHVRREEEGAGGTGPNIQAVLKGADGLVYNDGTLEELHRQVDEILARAHT